MNDVIIAIPTVNNLAYLRKAIESIKCSFPYELIVIDNGSSDGTSEWLKSKSVKCIHHDANLGCSYANNEAMQYAFSQDKIIYIIHNDIILHKDCLDHLYKGLTETNFELLFALEHLTGAVNPQVLKEFRFKYIYDKDNVGLPEDQDLKYTPPKQMPGINFTVRAIKKEAWEKVGYFDVNFYPAYFEDNDYGLRCLMAKVKIGIVYSARYYHFWSRSIHEGGVGPTNAKYFGINSQFYVRKWGGAVTKEIRKEENIKLFRTREEDYAIVKEKII